MTNDNEKNICSVDRVEGDYAVVECCGESRDLPLGSFGGRIPRSGEIYIFDGEKFEYSEQLTDSRRRKNARRTGSLFD